MIHLNISNLSDSEIRVYAKGLKRESQDWPVNLQPIIPIPQTPTAILAMSREVHKMIEVWRSRDFLVQVFAVTPEIERLSVNRCVIDITNKRWRDGITWDELQEIKRQVGRADFDAVEVFPSQVDVVNVANMRHLWVFKKKDALDFIWRKS